MEQSKKYTLVFILSSFFTLSFYLTSKIFLVKEGLQSKNDYKVASHARALSYFFDEYNDLQHAALTNILINHYQKDQLHLLIPNAKNKYSTLITNILASNQPYSINHTYLKTIFNFIEQQKYRTYQSQITIIEQLDSIYDKVTLKRKKALYYMILAKTAIQYCSSIDAYTKKHFSISFKTSKDIDNCRKKLENIYSQIDSKEFLRIFNYMKHDTIYTRYKSSSLFLLEKTTELLNTAPTDIEIQKCYENIYNMFSNVPATWVKYYPNKERQARLDKIQAYHTEYIHNKTSIKEK